MPSGGLVTCRDNGGVVACAANGGAVACLADGCFALETFRIPGDPDCGYWENRDDNVYIKDIEGPAEWNNNNMLGVYLEYAGNFNVSFGGTAKIQRRLSGIWRDSIDVLAEAQREVNTEKCDAEVVHAFGFYVSNIDTDWKNKPIRWRADTTLGDVRGGDISLVACQYISALEGVYSPAIGKHIFNTSKTLNYFYLPLLRRSAPFTLEIDLQGRGSPNIELVARGLRGGETIRSVIIGSGGERDISGTYRIEVSGSSDYCVFLSSRAGSNGTDYVIEDVRG